MHKFIKKHKRFASSKSKGFTLIELLVVIAIIGILAAIVLVSLNDARTSARETQRVGNIRNAQLALEIYYDKQNPGGYPGEDQTGGTCENPITGTTFADIGMSGVTDPATQVWMYGSNNATDGDATNYVLGVIMENSDNVPANDINGADVFGCDCGSPGDARYCVQP